VQQLTTRLHPSRLFNAMLLLEERIRVWLNLKSWGLAAPRHL